MLKSSEDARLEALDLLDTASSASLDRITRATVQLSDRPIADVLSTIGDRALFAAVAANARRPVIPDMIDDDDGASGLASRGVCLCSGASLTPGTVTASASSAC